MVNAGHPSARTAGEPRVRVEQASCAGSDGTWRIAWRITNLTASELRLLDVRFPHGQFRGDLMELAELAVEPRGSAGVEAVLACQGGPDDMVENAFLITTVEWRNVRWRILARFTVRFAEDGSPVTTTELVTVQRVGFSNPERQVPTSAV